MKVLHLTDTFIQLGRQSDKPFKEVDLGYEDKEIFTFKRPSVKLKPHLFDGLINLKKIDLGDIHLNTIHNDIFTGLDNLCDLNLSNNKIADLETNCLKGLYKLKTLNR